MAAIEGMWHTEPSPAGFNIIGFRAFSDQSENALT
jgi:cytochrome bd-type quinol oxidase subunit 1